MCTTNQICFFFDTSAIGRVDQLDLKPNTQCIFDLISFGQRHEYRLFCSGESFDEIFRDNAAFENSAAWSRYLTYRDILQALPSRERTSDVSFSQIEREVFYYRFSNRRRQPLFAALHQLSVNERKDYFILCDVIELEYPVCFFITLDSGFSADLERSINRQLQNQHLYFRSPDQDIQQEIRANFDRYPLLD